ncbi:MAG TPA: hypothetical protein VHZ96_03095 [Frankiaceae bacterium]|jgi:hypothetical protein|nr:hypothetical protein [Frankiaceae bacterium]
MLEQSRTERHRTVRHAIRDTTRFNGIPSRKVITVLVAFGALFTLLFALHSSTTTGPPLAKSCTTPAIALSATSTGDGTGIDYSITGPTSGTYVIAVDAATVAVKGSAADVTPRNAVAVSIHQGLSSCAAHGTLPDLTSGAHEVELFRDGTVAAKAALH